MMIHCRTSQDFFKKNLDIFWSKLRSMEGALTHTVDVGSIPTVGMLHVSLWNVENSNKILLVTMSVHRTGCCFLLNSTLNVYISLVGCGISPE